MIRIILLFLLLPIFSLAQTTTYDTTIIGSAGSAWNARITRPTNFFSSVDSSEMIIFLPGLGEVGTDATKLRIYGPHSTAGIGGTWDGSVVLGNGTHYPIIVSLQPTNTYTRPWDVLPKINALMTRFRVKNRALHMTGFSMGGWVALIFSSYKANSTDESYNRKVTSVVNIRGVKAADVYGSTLAYPNRYGNLAKNYGWKYLGFEQINDNREALLVMDNINDSIPGSGFGLWTNLGDFSHTAGMDVMYDPTSTNWSLTNPETQATKSANPYPSVPITAGQNIYQWMLRQGDTTVTVTAPDALITNAGTDFSVAYSFTSTPPFVIHGGTSQGVATGYSWTFISGPMTPTLTNTSTANLTVSNVTQSGYYTFRLTASDADESDPDDVTVWVRNWMEKNVTPCRTGTKSKFTVGASTSGSVVTTTTIYAPYIKRDGLFGSFQGGDTLEIVRNPNNGGVWNSIELGDIGGSSACPIVMTFKDTTVTIRSSDAYFRLGIRDSNIVCYVKIDGLRYQASKGIVYGFEVDNRGISGYSGNIGIVANSFHHLEIGGFAAKHVATGLFMKMNSDSTFPHKIFNNFIYDSLYIHDIYLEDIEGEGLYIGHTDIAGNLQSGNHGPTVKGNNLKIERVAIYGAGWDGLQVSNMGTNAIIRDIAAYKTGTTNQSSQQFSIFLGGNTQGKLYNSATINSTGPMGFLGKGVGQFYNNVIDSANNGKLSPNNDVDGLYAQQSNSGVTPPYDSLKLFSHNNWVRGVTRYPIYHANAATGNSMAKGKISDNIFINTLTAASNASDTIVSNANVTSYDLDGALTTHTAYQVAKMMKASPGTAVSFFNISNFEPPVVDAGENVILPISTTSTVLTSTATPVSPNTISAYLWSQVSGPNTAVISNTAIASPTISSLIAGTYVFRIAVVDNLSQTASDDVVVTVLSPAPPAATPVIQIKKGRRIVYQVIP